MSEVRKHAMAWMVLVAIVGTCFAGSARAEEKRIAVVNVSDVFGRYARVKDVQEKLTKEFEPKQQAMQATERKLKNWKEKIEADSALYENPKKEPKLFAEQLKLQQAAFDFQIEYEELLKSVEERRKNEMKAVLGEIRRAISSIGKSEKFDLVLRAPEYDDVFDPIKAGDTAKPDEGVSAAELVRRFRDNPVLYFASGVNITEKVLDQLNTDYKAAPKK
jgi:outer membrane protein